MSRSAAVRRAMTRRLKSNTTNRATYRSTRETGELRRGTIADGFGFQDGDIVVEAKPSPDTVRELALVGVQKFLDDNVISSEVARQWMDNLKPKNLGA